MSDKKQTEEQKQKQACIDYYANPPARWSDNDLKKLFGIPNNPPDLTGKKINIWKPDQKK